MNAYHVAAQLRIRASALRVFHQGNIQAENEEDAARFFLDDLMKAERCGMPEIKIDTILVQSFPIKKEKS